MGWETCTATQRRYNDFLIKLLHHSIYKQILLPRFPVNFVDNLLPRSEFTSCEEHDYFKKLGSRTSSIVVPSDLALEALYSADLYTGLVLLTMSRRRDRRSRLLVFTIRLDRQRVFSSWN
jgi:hypothetical protein